MAKCQPIIDAMNAASLRWDIIAPFGIGAVFGILLATAVVVLTASSKP